MTPPISPAPRRARRLSFGLQVAIAMVLGLGLGLAARALGPTQAGESNLLVQALQLTGSTFIQLLKVLVAPLVFTALVASVANLRDLNNAAKLVWQTLLWFALTALISVAIGLALGTIFQPGASAQLSSATTQTPHMIGGWLDFLKGLIPRNILGLEATIKIDEVGAATTSLSFNILQIVVISIAVGIATLRAGPAGEPFLDIIRSALAILRRLLGWVIRLAPIGTAGLFGTAVAEYGWSTLGELGRFAFALYVGLGLVLFVVYPLLLRWHGLSIRRFFAGAWPAIQLGFVSRSSVGTLPLTEKVTEERLGVPRSYAAFAVPLAATTKMDGCAALYPALAALFVAQFYGVPLDFADYGLIAFVSVVGSAATAGLTGALVMLTLTLSTLGLPLEGAGLLLAIDPILDMGRTAVNVAGQALIPTIVAKRNAMLDMDVYNGGYAADGELPD